MKTRLLIYLLLGAFLSTRYTEENIEGEEDEPKYKVEDSEDPLDHFIYGFYHDYGVFILYDYEEDPSFHYCIKNSPRKQPVPFLSIQTGYRPESHLSRYGFDRFPENSSLLSPVHPGTIHHF